MDVVSIFFLGSRTLARSISVDGWGRCGAVGFFACVRLESGVVVGGWFAWHNITQHAFTAQR